MSPIRYIHHRHHNTATSTWISHTRVVVFAKECTWLDQIYLGLTGQVHTNPGPPDVNEDVTWASFFERDGLKIVSQNMQRVLTGGTNKVDRLKEMLHNKRGPLILGCSESWLTPHDTDGIVNLPGYKLIRTDRGTGDRSMGFLVYYSPQLRLSQVDVTRDRDFTMYRIDVLYQSVVYTVCFVYRPPRANRIQNFLASFRDKMSQFAQRRSDRIIILGDFNFDMLRPNAATTQQFQEIFSELNLTQKLEKPTRIARYGDNITSTLIDHVYTNNGRLPHSILLLNTDEHISDHHAVGILLKSNKGQIQSHRHTYVNEADFNKYDIEAVRAALRSMNWLDVELADDIDDKVELFNRKIKSVLYSLCGTKKIRTCGCCPDDENKLKWDKNKPWFTPELKKMKTIVDKWLQLYKSSNSAVHFDTYRDFLKVYQAAIKRACDDYHTKKLANSTDPKKTQAIVDSLLGTLPDATERIDKIIFNGVTATDDLGMANLMNRHYTEVGLQASNEADATLPDFITFQNQPPELHILSPGMYNTYKYLTEIDVNKPPGPEQVPGKFYKEFALEIMFILEHIFAACINRSTIPKCWKLGQISPLYKGKGDKSEPGNHRPIAITSVLSKIFERIIYDQLIEHLELHKLIKNSQYGYRKSMSTFHAIMDVTEKLRVLSDGPRRFVGLLLLDLSKAFDCVNHRLLSLMLPKYGLDENSVKLIKSFLSDRTQCVKVNGKISDIIDVLCGVPQGSLLGPILFDLYVNFFSEIVDSYVVQYADDAAVLRYDNDIDSLKRRLAADLFVIVRFFKSLGLRLNVSKTEFLLLGKLPTNTDTSLILHDGTIILPVHQARYLGIIIDDQLKFHEQNKIVINKLKRANHSIRAIRKKIPLNIAIKLLHSLVYAHHDYGCPIWTQEANSNLTEQMEVQHRFCLKSVFQRGWRYPTDRIYKLAQQPTLHKRRLMATCRFVHASLENTTPARFINYFERSRTERGRDSRRLITPISSLQNNIVRKSVKRYGVTVWNNLPEYLRCISRPIQFKFALQKFFRPPAL